MKVCSMESGLKHRGQRSSSDNLYLFNSFLVVINIILCKNVKENCLNLFRSGINVAKPFLPII